MRGRHIRTADTSLGRICTYVAADAEPDRVRQRIFPYNKLGLLTKLPISVGMRLPSKIDRNYWHRLKYARWCTKNVFFQQKYLVIPTKSFSQCVDLN